MRKTWGSFTRENKHKIPNHSRCTGAHHLSCMINPRYPHQCQAWLSSVTPKWHLLLRTSYTQSTKAALKWGNQSTSHQHLGFQWPLSTSGWSTLPLTWIVRLLLVFRTFLSASWKALCSLCSMVWANLQDCMLSDWLTNCSTRMRVINQRSPKLYVLVPWT